MNARKCKAARKLAKQLTIGKPDRLLLQRTTSNTIFNAPNTTRGAYRSLKKLMRQGARIGDLTAQSSQAKE